MKYTIVVGSQRANSNSAKVGEFLKKRILDLFLESSVYTLDLFQAQLPLFDATIWQGNQEVVDKFAPIKKELEESEGIVVITPEWGGAATPIVKNFFLYATRGLLSHKAGLIVSVSAGQNAAYPVADLRSFTHKNTHICYIPEQLIIRNVGNVLNAYEEFDIEDANTDDIYIRERIEYTLKLFNEYTKALKPVRESGLVDLNKYPNGM